MKRYGIRTVFGMGGSYIDGKLAVVLLFTTELLSLATVELFPSLISNFKMATSHLVAQKRSYRSA